MRKSSKAAIITMIVLFILNFAVIVPYIVFPAGKLPAYEMFEELSSVRTWLDENGVDVQDVGKDSYLGDTETVDSVNVSFLYAGEYYRLSAHIFETKEALRNYYASRTGYGTDLDQGEYFTAYYFSTSFCAFEGNRLIALSGGDYLAFLQVFGDLFGKEENATSSESGQSAASSESCRSVMVSESGQGAVSLENERSAELSESGQNVIVSESGQGAASSESCRSAIVSESRQSAVSSECGQSAVLKIVKGAQNVSI